VVLSRERFAGELRDGIRAGRSFLEGVGAISLAAEGQVVGAFAPFARSLEMDSGLSPRPWRFATSTSSPMPDRSDVGDPIVVKHAQSEEASDRAGSGVRSRRRSPRRGKSSTTSSGR
jgi:hypothetical protein